jgi:two-component system, LytTR family, response regulator
MMGIRTLVVDDEPLARSRMKRLLADHPDVEVVGEAADGTAAVSEVLRLRPDVVFLDVNMPGSTGTECLRAIHAALPEDLWPLAVFTTAYEEHAVEAFALEGTDYLLKPVERDTLARALRRVRKVLWRDSAAVAAPPTPPAPPEEESTGHLAAYRAGRIVSLALDDVACVVVEDTITFATTADGRFRLKSTLHEAEARLPSPPFVRISRSAIVQLSWVATIEPMASGRFEVVLRAPVDLRLAVSRRRGRRLRQLLGW